LKSKIKIKIQISEEKINEINSVHSPPAPIAVNPPVVPITLYYQKGTPINPKEKQRKRRKRKSNNKKKKKKIKKKTKKKTGLPPIAVNPAVMPMPPKKNNPTTVKPAYP
jgi:hypothetical protein